MDAKRLRRFFLQQKNNAKSRGIPFKLTFDQWLTIWTESGKLEKRGRNESQYCMARHGDKGAYEIGNVKIILGSANIQEREITDEHRWLYGTALRGKKRPPRTKAWRQRLSKAKKEYTYTDQHRNAIAQVTKGEKNPSAKLTEDDVRAIRKSELSAKELSETYGVSSMAIRFIWRRRTWAHVK